MEDNNDELFHFGTKGMKWGVRKDKKSSASSDAEEAHGLRKKSLAELSNAELKSLNNRRQLEAKFQQLNPTTIDRGKAHVKTVIATAGTAAAVYNLVKSPAGQAAVSVGRKVAKPIIIGVRAKRAFG